MRWSLGSGAASGLLIAQASRCAPHGSAQEVGMARVALVASSFLPRVGGVEEHVANVAVELRDRGHEVVVWAADRGDVPLRDHRGIRVRYLPCPLPTRSVSGVARFGAALPAARRVWTRALREDAPEVLHVQCFGPNGVYAEWL